MSSTTLSQQNEVIDELLKERFPCLNGVRVAHPRGLVPVVLAQHLVLEEASKLEAYQEKALGDAAALLDTAQQKAREIRFLHADSLSGWHRLAQLRRLEFMSVADRLIEAFEIAKQAGITLSISTGMVPDGQDPDGGRMRYVLIDAASVRAIHATPTSQIASNGVSLAGAGADARDLSHEAALIAAGYIARHPEAAGEMPALIERIASALQTCGTLPTDVEQIPHLAGVLAKVLAPRIEEPATLAATCRHRSPRRKVPAGL